MTTDGLFDRLEAEVASLCRCPVRAVLLIGSRAEGCANASSDIDLIAIVPEPPSGRFKVREHAFEFGGRPGSIVYLTERMLRRRLGSLDKLYQSGGHITDGVATRVANARVIHDPERIGRELVTLARCYRPAADTLQEMMRVCLGFLHDALGSRAAGDHATAVLMARVAASVAVDCFLLHSNERNLKSKWHLRRLRTLGSTPVLEAYLRVLGLDGADADVSTRVVNETERLLCSVLKVPDLHRYRESVLFASADDSSTSASRGISR
jgi:hypothetical protein